MAKKKESKKEAPKEHKKPWQETTAGVQEIQDFLRGRIMLRRNALTGLVEMGEYHPFRQYLEHLPPWDGVSDHILAMSMSVQVKGGAEEQQLFAQYLKRHRLPGGDGEDGGDDS